jgi:plastocyanin
MKPQSALLAGVLLLATALAGCAGDGGTEEECPDPSGTSGASAGGSAGGNASQGNVSAEAGAEGEGEECPEPTGTGTGPTGNATGAVSVTILEYDDNASVGQPFNVTWEVTSDEDVQLEITETTVFWASQSVSGTPETPEDYGNQSDSSSTGTIPQEFNTTITVDQADTVYFRAYAVVDGQEYWSEEQSVEVGGGVGDAVEVEITSGLLMGIPSTYDPQEVTIKVGGSIVWTNGDSVVHTATATDGSFDTGPIEPDNTSAPIVFMTAGEYEYRSEENDSPTLTGTVIVEEA